MALTFSLYVFLLLQIQKLMIFSLKNKVLTRNTKRNMLYAIDIKLFSIWRGTRSSCEILEFF